MRADLGPPSPATNCAAVLLIAIDSIPLIGPIDRVPGCYWHQQGVQAFRLQANDAITM